MHATISSETKVLELQEILEAHPRWAMQEIHGQWYMYRRERAKARGMIAWKAK